MGHFVRVDNEFVDQSLRELEPAEFMVLMVLWRHKNYRNGECYPSEQTIADKTNLSVRSVARALKSLREKHKLEWVHETRKKGGIRNRYTLLI